MPLHATEETKRGYQAVPSGAPQPRRLTASTRPPPLSFINCAWWNYGLLPHAPPPGGQKTTVHALPFLPVALPPDRRQCPPMLPWDRCNLIQTWRQWRLLNSHTPAPASRLTAFTRLPDTTTSNIPNYFHGWPPPHSSLYMGGRTFGYILQPVSTAMPTTFRCSYKRAAKAWFWRASGAGRTSAQQTPHLSTTSSCLPLPNITSCTRYRRDFPCSLP